LNPSDGKEFHIGGISESEQQLEEITVLQDIVVALPVLPTL
jgi:hypothetical protein